ncbi:hypothetical protein WN943_014428 [Citrus x changshan-huyou]
MQKALWSEKGHTHLDFTQRGHYLVRLRMVGRQGRQGEGDYGVRGASEHATEIRNGSKVSKLPAKELVPGDIVALKIRVETKIGKVHKQIYVASPNKEVTPMKKKLNDFGEVLTNMIGVICVLYG